MKEGMGEATINEQQQGMIIKVVGAVAVAHLLNDLIQAVLPAIYPMLKTNFSLSFAQVTDFIGVSNYGIATATLDWTLYRQASETLSIATRHGSDF